MHSRTQGLGDFNRIDRKLRTNNFAIMAVDTPFRLEDFGGVVAFFIEAGGKGQNIPGAELDTISAPFAAVFDDMYTSFGNLNGFRIQWNSPESHRLILLDYYTIFITTAFDHAVVDNTTDQQMTFNALSSSGTNECHTRPTNGRW